MESISKLLKKSKSCHIQDSPEKFLENTVVIESVFNSFQKCLDY